MRTLMTILAILISTTISAQAWDAPDGMYQIMKRTNEIPASYDGYQLYSRLGEYKDLKCHSLGKCSGIIVMGGKCQEETSRQPEEVVCTPISPSHTTNGVFKVKSEELIYRGGILEEIWETMDADPADVKHIYADSWHRFRNSDLVIKFTVNKKIGRGLMIIKKLKGDNHGQPL